MKNRTEVGTERILCSSVGRVLTLATLLALTFGIVGCQNGKCQSCLFRSRDKEKIDETQLGQVKNQEPPAPPAIAPTSSVDGSAAGQEQRVVIDPTPITTNPAPASSLAANDFAPQRIPNTASGVDAALSSRQPTLEPLPDANSQARNFSDPNALPSQRYQSVSPIVPDSALGFAPAEQDHSAYLAPEAKTEPLPPAPTASLPPEMLGSSLPPEMTGLPSTATPETVAPVDSTAPLPAEMTEQPASAISRGADSATGAIQPPTESATPDPNASAPENGEAAYSPTMRDQYAIEAAYALKQPVTLKGTARAQYVGNTAATPSAASAAQPATRSAARPSVVAQPSPTVRPPRIAQPSAVASAAPASVPRESSAFVPNGQTSNIIPGMKLGVVDFSQRAK